MSSPVARAEVPIGRRTDWGMGDWCMIFFGGILMAVLGSVLGVVIANATHGRSLTDAELEINAWTIGVSSIAQFSLFIAAVWGLSAWKGSRNRVHDFGLRFSFADVWAFPVGLLLQFGANIVLLPITSLPGHEEQSVVTNLKDSKGPAFYVLTLVAVLLAPVVEEFLFRGLLLRSLLRRFRAPIAVAVCGAWFGAIHVLLDPKAIVSLPALCAMGAAASIVSVRNGDISPAIWMHVGFNFPVVLLLFI